MGQGPTGLKHVDTVNARTACHLADTVNACTAGQIERKQKTNLNRNNEHNEGYQARMSAKSMLSSADDGLEENVDGPCVHTYIVIPHVNLTFLLNPKAQVRQEWVGGTKISWTQFNLTQNGPVYELRQEHKSDRVSLNRALTPESKKTSQVTSLLFSSPRALSFARTAGLAHAAH